MSEHREHLLSDTEGISCRGALILGRRADLRQRIYPRSRSLPARRPPQAGARRARGDALSGPATGSKGAGGQGSGAGHLAATEGSRQPFVPARGDQRGTYPAPRRSQPLPPPQRAWQPPRIASGTLIRLMGAEPDLCGGLRFSSRWLRRTDPVGNTLTCTVHRLEPGPAQRPMPGQRHARAAAPRSEFRGGRCRPDVDGQARLPEPAAAE